MRDSHSENHPVLKRRDLGLALVSRSDDHPVGFADTPPKRGIFLISSAEADEIHPSRRLWRPQKNAFPKGRRLPLKAGGEFLSDFEN
jgi:hypothetical protein